MEPGWFSYFISYIAIFTVLIVGIASLIMLAMPSIGMLFYAPNGKPKAERSLRVTIQPHDMDEDY